MTYDWNKQVEITVPTGTNGWIYSGEVIINGVKVRFPVGVPTTVPEPAAALLNKMIELEREDENNTAKPDNHYVGSVTIPEGKTLTLAKGAKVVDEDGLLGGSSAPAPVVILPETELTAEGAQYMLYTPPENAPIGGGNYRIVWDDVEYFSPALDVTGTIGEGTPMFAFGNSAVAFGEDGAAQIGNPAPGAPYFLALIPNGKEVTEGGPIAYGMLAATEEPTAPVLSIVQTEDAASGGNVGGGGELFVVNATTADGSTVTVDKTYDEIATAVSTKKFGICCLDLMGTQTLYLPFAVITQNTFVFSAHVPNIDAAVTVNSDGTSNLDFTMLT